MSFELQGSGTYEDVVLQAKALIEDEPELVPNMANLSALLNLTLKNINWVGFSFVRIWMWTLRWNGQGRDAVRIFGYSSRKWFLPDWREDLALRC